MARVTITLPEIIKRPDGFIADLRRAAIAGIDAGTAQGATTIAASPEMPVARGHLRRSIAHVPARVVAGGVVTGAIRSSGPAAAYVIPQESGRRKGAPRPPARQIESWVRRERADAVDELARKLQADYAAAHPKKRKGKRRTIAKYRRRAIFLLARAVVRKLVARGMEGRKFVATHRDAITADVRQTVDVEVSALLRRKGLT